MQAISRNQRAVRSQAAVRASDGSIRDRATFWASPLLLRELRNPQIREGCLSEFGELLLEGEPPRCAWAQQYVRQRLDQGDHRFVDSTTITRRQRLMRSSAYAASCTNIG